MMSTSRSGRGGLVWAIAGGLVLIAGIVAIVVTAILSQPAPSVSPQPGATLDAPTPAATVTGEPGGEVVDPSASARGWAPEPITTDPETYVRAALTAASTFDTTLSTREEWLDYLDTWFTPDTRYASEADQLAAMAASQVELRQGVVLPQEQWESLTNEDGRVVAAVASAVALGPVPEDPSGDMSIGTADVTLTFTRSDGGEGETSYDETVRVSVQVLCGRASTPTPGTAQQAGDCKVVRYFTGPMEP